jgi:chorismate synthase
VIIDAIAEGDAAPAGRAVDDRQVEIRHVRTNAELAQCVELQRTIWGSDFREAVPAAILKISQRLGGVTAGAFAADGTLLGFVFGMTGVEQGTIVHWSDMLAVDARAANHGIGRRLKEFQRESARAIGATRMYWSYDPLVARNAHLNLNRLGARVSEYVPDMYGAQTGSALHSGVGTDRFVVVWPIAPGADRQAPAPSLAGWRESLVLNAAGSSAEQDDMWPDLAAYEAAPPPLARVAIPADIFAVQQKDVEQAGRWRRSTRRAFQWALAHGYDVERFERDPAGDRGFYILARHPPPASTVR